jgi:hypothetical protein
MKKKTDLKLEKELDKYLIGHPDEVNMTTSLLLSYHYFYI